MISCWNQNMSKQFIPSWINCIDKSMSKWVNEYTFLGFMFVPRKPWPFGNEYHDACCTKSDIIWSVDLHKGKDRPRELGVKEYNDEGKTVGTLLQLTVPIWGGGKVLVLDSGFCVLKAIVELKKRGVFTASLIKKGSIGQSISMVRQSSNTFRTKKLEQQTLYLECWMMYLLRYTA